MDIRMPLLDGLKAGKRIIEDQLTQSIIYLSAYSDEADTDTAGRIGAVVFSKTIIRAVLAHNHSRWLSASWAQPAACEKVEKLSVKLEQRKVIERAKGVLMAENNMTENAAYKMLRDLSMTKRCPMNDIAELIVTDAWWLN